MSATPRILFVSPEYPPAPGGIGDYTASLAVHLARLGATVVILTGGETTIADDENGVTVLRSVPHWRWGLPVQITRIANQRDIHIVHIQYQTGMYGMQPAVNLLPFDLGWYPAAQRIASRNRAPRRRFRIVTTFHDLLPPYLFPKAGRVRDGATRLLARTSGAVIATNGTDRAQLARWHVPAALVPVGSSIPAAITPDANVRTCYGIAPGALLLTTFGLLNHSKGLETLIAALAQLRGGGIAAHLLLVGAGAGENDSTNRDTAAALRAQAAAWEVAPFVTHTGTLPASVVAGILAASDICVLPFRDGASPRRTSLLAALAQGIPVVTTTPQHGIYDGLPALTDGDHALFVPPDDSTALAAAIRRVQTDGSLAARLRVGARAYAAQFTWDAIARQHLALYAGTGISALGEEENAQAEANPIGKGTDTWRQ